MWFVAAPGGTEGGERVSLPEPTHDTPVAAALRVLKPDYGWCGRCGVPWVDGRQHRTDFDSGESCFPLCEQCWRLLGTPEARLPYYDALLDHWQGDGETPHWLERGLRSLAAKRWLVHRAVLLGG